MKSIVVYNGGTGGLGRHFGAALANIGLRSHSLASRLGDSRDLTDELYSLSVESGSFMTFIQSAGMVSVASGQDNPTEAFDVNVTRTGATVDTLVRWATDHDITPGVVFVSSGHVYAAPKHGHRLTESSPTEPRSVYAETKLEGEQIVGALAATHGVDLAIGRVFGMLAPAQPPGFLLPGLIERVRSGDLAAVPGLDYIRDYLDARDVARHLVALASPDGTPHPPVVNICSGEETRIGSLLDELLTLFHGSDPAALAEARTRVGAAPGRQTDVPWSVGDPALLSELISGPIRSIALADTLAAALAAS